MVIKKRVIVTTTIGLTKKKKIPLASYMFLVCSWFHDNSIKYHSNCVLLLQKCI